MLGERIVIEDEHREASRRIIDIILPELIGPRGKYVITIAGESGSGKSGIAHEVTRRMNEKGIETVLFQQDDYFFQPPKTNYELRRKDLSRVGTAKVNMDLLVEHINKFRDPATTRIKKPLVIFDEDRITEETIHCGTVRLLVVEGTYVSLIKGADKKIFLSKTYKDTLADRQARSREAIDSFDEKILEIEHNIISSHKEMNEIVIEKDYSIVYLSA